MKTIIVTMLSCFISLTVMGQGVMDPGKVEKAGIYYLNIKLAEELITNYKVKNNSRNYLNGYSDLVFIPDDLIDSIKILTEKLCGPRFHVDAECIYKTSEKGNVITTSGFGSIEGLPINTFKGAQAVTNMKYYIKIDVNIFDGGQAIIIGDGKKSKMKPKVTAFIKVYDVDKNLVWKNRATLKKFGSLRTNERTRGNVTRTYSETLSPYDIYMIYELTLIELLFED